MIKRLAKFIDENLASVGAVLFIFIFGITVGIVIGIAMAVDEVYTPEPESNFIIYDYPLTGEDIYSRYHEYFEDTYELPREYIVEVLEEYLENIQIRIKVDDDNDFSDITTDWGYLDVPEVYPENYLELP